MRLEGFFVTCSECKKLHAAQVQLVCTCGAYVPTWERHSAVPPSYYPYQPRRSK